MTKIQQMRIDDHVHSLDLTNQLDIEEILLANATGEEIDKIRQEIDELL